MNLCSYLVLGILNFFLGTSDKLKNLSVQDFLLNQVGLIWFLSLISYSGILLPVGVGCLVGGLANLSENQELALLYSLTGQRISELPESSASQQNPKMIS